MQNMAASEDQCFSGMLQFPQPSKPLYADSNMFQERFSNQFSEGYYNFEESSTKTPEEGEQFVSDDDLIHIFEEFVEELNDKGHELFHKVLSKVEKEARFDKLRMFLAKLESSTGVISDPTTMERGVNVESSSTVEDIRGKLERFKVKTINLGGIVREGIKK